MNSSLFIAIILGTALMCAIAEAKESWIVAGKSSDKISAVRAKLQDPGVEVLKCVPQELTEKLTLRGVRKK